MLKQRRIESRNLVQKKTRRNYNATHIPISIQPTKDWRGLQLGDSDSVGPTGTLWLGDSDSVGPTGTLWLGDSDSVGPTGTLWLGDSDLVGPTGTQAPSYWRTMSYCRE